MGEELNIKKINTEKALLAGIKKSDEKAFAELFNAWYHFALEVAFHYCNHEDAEEIAGDFFCKLWQNRQKVDGIHNFKNYLFVSVKNQCLNALRKRKMDTVALENIFDIHDFPENDPWLGIVTSELETQMNQSIENLPPKCREIFLLVREEGLHYREVAEKLSISMKTVDVQLSRATRKIMDVFRKYGMSWLIALFP